MALPGRPSIPLLSTNDFFSSSGQAAAVGPNILKKLKVLDFFEKALKKSALHTGNTRAGGGELVLGLTFALFYMDIE